MEYANEIQSDSFSLHNLEVNQKFKSPFNKCIVNLHHIHDLTVDLRRADFHILIQNVQSLRVTSGGCNSALHFLRPRLRLDSV